MSGLTFMSSPQESSGTKVPGRRPARYAGAYRPTREPPLARREVLDGPDRAAADFVVPKRSEILRVAGSVIAQATALPPLAIFSGSR